MHNRLTLPNRPTILYGTYVYDERVHRGILRFGRQHRWKVRLLRPHSWEHAEMLDAQGIISMLEPEDESGGMTGFLLSKQLPMVDLALSCPEANALRLLPDAREAGRIAGEYFRDSEYASWVHVCWGRTWHDDLRIEGFSAVAEKIGMPWTLVQMRDHDGRRMDEILRCLETLPKPVGVFCSFDHYAEQVLEICLENGFPVPADVAILGCYNHEVHSVFAEVPISSIDMALEERGYQAAALLQGLMSGEPVPAEPIYSPVKGVIERASTSPSSSRDNVVAQAVHFIVAQMRHPVGVEEVASAVGVSRAALQRRFERVFGHGVGREINRRKMEHAAKLLLEENDSAAMVAGRIGFPDALHFYRVFKRYFGFTTKEYRARHIARRQ